MVTIGADQLSRLWVVVESTSERIPLLGGAVTHLGDRLFREHGFVRGPGSRTARVDFHRLRDWFIGTVADIAILAGGRWPVRQGRQARD